MGCGTVPFYLFQGHNNPEKLYPLFPCVSHLDSFFITITIISFMSSGFVPVFVSGTPILILMAFQYYVRNSWPGFKCNARSQPEYHKITYCAIQVWINRLLRQKTQGVRLILWIVFNSIVFNSHSPQDVFDNATYCLKLVKLSVKESFDQTPALIFLSKELVPQFFDFFWVYRFAIRHPRSSVAQVTGCTCLSDGFKIWFDDCSFFFKIK